MTKKNANKRIYCVRLQTITTYRPVLVKAESAEKALDYVDSNFYALDEDGTESDFDNSEVVEITDDRMRDTYARDAEDWTEDDES